MRQFDVFDNPSLSSRTFAPYVVLLQSHYLDILDTAVVAPLITDAEPRLTPFDVLVDFNNRALVIAVQELAAIDRRLLHRVRGNLTAHEYEIRRALGRLFTGF